MTVHTLSVPHFSYTVVPTRPASSSISPMQIGASMTTTHSVLLAGSVAPSIPAAELWLWKDTNALTAVRRGLDDARAGRLSYLGSFAQYADDDSADD